MAWIEAIGFAEATGKLRATYGRIAGPKGSIDNILIVHGLRPHTLSGHLALYKSVLHHTGNRLPVWFLEAVGVLVSHINGCTYCETHHAEGLRRRLDDDARALEMIDTLRDGRFEAAFDQRETAALRYAAKLTVAPASVGSDDIETMRSYGMTDGEILEVNQVAAYFAYANRTASGLGVVLDGDQLGLSPPDTDDLSDWEHH